MWVEGTEAGQRGTGSESGDGAADGQSSARLVSGSPTDVALPGMPLQFGRGIVYYLQGSQVLAKFLSDPGAFLLDIFYVYWFAKPTISGQDLSFTL